LALLALYSSPFGSTVTREELEPLLACRRPNGLWPAVGVGAAGVSFWATALAVNTLMTLGATPEIFSASLDALVHCRPLEASFLVRLRFRLSDQQVRFDPKKYGWPWVTGLDCLWLPRTVLTSDFVVSMPKVKTHHWAGVTLSMKNLFGLMPGVAYGWPKNLLHWKGIDRSILDINAAVPAHFVIADGIIGMEGNGPLHGAPRDLGRVVLADDPVAADFVCSRLMGLNPLRVNYLAQAAEFLGNGTPERIVHLGEMLPPAVQPFAVLPEFAHLRF
jgi:hypothetical protein